MTFTQGWQWHGYALVCAICNFPWKGQRAIEPCTFCGAYNTASLVVNGLEFDGEAVRVVDP